MKLMQHGSVIYDLSAERAVLIVANHAKSTDETRPIDLCDKCWDAAMKDASEIITAYNSHAELLEALERARKMLGPHSLHPDAEGFAMIDAALAKARGIPLKEG